MAKTTTVAHQLADILAAWGVQFVFGTAGDSILHFLACLHEHPIRYVQLRNEETAAYAASAYAKLTGKLGVAISDGGPGTAHIINGLADAIGDRTPVLAVTGQVESTYIGTDHKQYINQQQLLGAVTLHSENLGNPLGLATVVGSLIRAAFAQAGPVHLSVPKDFWQQKVRPVQVKPEPYLGQAPHSPEQVIDDAARWLRGKTRPVLLVGRGARHALTEVLALADILGAGVVHTLPIVGVMPQHPLAVGGIGAGGSEAAVNLLGQCDCVIKVGATYWPPALTSDSIPALSIDIHPANIGRGIPADFGVVGDAKAVIAALLQRLSDFQPRTDWRSQVEKQACDWNQRLADEIDRAPAGHPGRVVRTLSEWLPPSAVVCLDVGDHVLWFNRFFQGRGQEVLVSGHWRGMGFSLGAAIAAQLALPDSPVMSIVGDGGFSMLMGEFASAVALELPIIILLMNNESYAMEANAMAAAGLAPFGVRLTDVRYDQVAEASGGVGLRTTPAELPAVLREINRTTKPVLIDLKVDPIPLPTAKL
ncbi:MAG: thiamine pyrophosphate-binding protein [Limnochordia bacterium]